jgi:predicted TIM-barrel fold metal-dependent hydrolase
MSTNDQRTESPREGGLTLVDCDVHQGYGSEENIIKYLPDRYKDRGVHVPNLNYNNPAGIDKPSSFPDADHAGDLDDIGREYAASTYDIIREEVIEENDADYIILNSDTGLTINGIPNRDYAYELARAFNEWLIAEWLPGDDRILCSLFVAMESPEQSAAMIRKLGDHPQVRQVLIQGATGRKPFGHPYYWPVYEAAEEMGLPVGVHTSSAGSGVSNPVTGAGHPNNYFEWHTLYATNYMGLLASIISEGVFEEFPDLKLALIEGGYTWLPWFIWRIDNEWKALRSQAPWLDQPPSEYIYDHVRFTTQPSHMPDDPDDLKQLMEIIDAEKLLMFSSDYPHWDGDSPDHALPPSLSKEKKERIYYKNAQAFYNLPDDPSDLG